MKFLKKISLRLRITLLAAAILILCSVLLTVMANLNASDSFFALSQANMAFLPADSPSSITVNVVPAQISMPAVTLSTATRQFNMKSAIYLAAVSVVGTTLVYVVAGRSLRPIRRLSETAAAITGDNLRLRIPEDNRHDEVGTLGRSFNIMLDRLDKAFRMQKQFSANVAHELKTPLATINAGIQVLRLDASPTVADYEKILTTAEHNVNRLIAVVDDLLELCRTDDDLCVSDIDLPDMIEAIAEELRPLISDKHAQIETACTIRTVRGNPDLIYRAFFNLIENAIKYNCDGGKISIRTFDDNGMTKISITDTGCGIPEEDLQSIFEPFYRVSKSRSRKTGGAGLGLSIVKTILDKHGWEITAASVPGEGATFTVTCRID